MKILTQITSIIILIIFLVTSNNQINTFASSSVNSNGSNIANVAVLLNNFDDFFTQTLIQSLEDIQKKNPDKVKFTFFDGKGNISTEFEIIDSVLKNKFDLLIANIPTTQEDVLNDVIFRAKQSDIPLILIGPNLQAASKVSKIYDRVAFILPDATDAGTIEGKILVDLWNTNKSNMDKNGDNIMQYVVLQGSLLTVPRTQEAVAAINNSGIKTEELQLTDAYFSKELAKTNMESLILKYNNKIEAIISNNDAMAIGAIEALQKYGYNTEDKSKYIPVVGIEGLPEAKDLIDKGFMTGTVVLSPTLIAEGVYNIGMNLIKSVNPIENTNYKYIDGVILVPFVDKEYMHKVDTP